MSGVEGAILGAVASNVSSAVLNWLQNQGPEISEEEWEDAGYQICLEVRALHEQQKNDRELIKKLRQELKDAGKTYQKLSIVGEDFGFDERLVELYSKFAKAAAEWALSLKFNDGSEEEVEAFYKLNKRYTDIVT